MHAKRRHAGPYRGKVKVDDDIHGLHIDAASKKVCDVRVRETEHFVMKAMAAPKVLRPTQTQRKRM